MKIKCGGIEPSKKGWINIDKYKLEYTDLAVDLDKFPYPFKNNSIEEIKCENVLEHLLYPIDTLKEFSRILKKGGILKIRLPFYNHTRSYEELSHLHYCGYNIMEISIDRYLKGQFKIVYKKLFYSRFALIRWKILGHIIPSYITFIDWHLKKL